MGDVGSPAFAEQRNGGAGYLFAARGAEGCGRHCDLSRRKPGSRCGSGTRRKDRGRGRAVLNRPSRHQCLSAGGRCLEACSSACRSDHDGAVDTHCRPRGGQRRPPPVLPSLTLKFPCEAARSLRAEGAAWREAPSSGRRRRGRPKGWTRRSRGTRRDRARPPAALRLQGRCGVSPLEGVGRGLRARPQGKPFPIHSRHYQTLPTYRD
jgi:hypothetical protein